jgi:hypothetical protein
MRQALVTDRYLVPNESHRAMPPCIPAFPGCKGVELKSGR